MVQEFNFKQFISKLDVEALNAKISAPNFEVPNRNLNSFSKRLISKHGVDYTLYDYKAAVIWGEFLDLMKDSGLTINKTLSNLSKPYKTRRAGYKHMYSDNYLYLTITDSNLPTTKKISSSNSLHIHIFVRNLSKRDPELTMLISDSRYGVNGTITKPDYIMNYVTPSAKPERLYLDRSEIIVAPEYQGQMQIARIAESVKLYFTQRKAAEVTQAKTDMKDSLYVRKTYHLIANRLKEHDLIITGYDNEVEDFVNNNRIIWTTSKPGHGIKGLYVSAELCTELENASYQKFIKMYIFFNKENTYNYLYRNSIMIRRALTDDIEGALDEFVKSGKILEKLINLT